MNVFTPEQDYIMTYDKKEANLLAEDGYKIEVLYICIKED